MAIGSRRVLLRAGAVAPTYVDRIRELPGLIAHWPLTDTSGTTAANLQGPGRDGTYENSPTLAATAFPAGSSVASFDGTDDQVDVFTAGLASAISWTKGWFLLWAKAAATFWQDSSRYYLAQLASDGDPDIRFYREETYTIYGYYESTFATRKTMAWPISSENWVLLALSWDHDADLVHFYTRDAQVGEGSSLGTPSGTLTGAKLANRASGATYFAGSLGHAAIGAGYPLDQHHISELYDAVYPNARHITFAGDSKANENDWWTARVIQGLESNTGDVWTEKPVRLFGSGYTAAQLHTYVDANIADVDGDPEYVLVHIGANDIPSLPAEAAWKADLQGIIDAYLNRFHTATVYVAKPWRGDADYETECNTLAGWIDDVVGSTARAEVGHDERSWFKDNVATYSDDSVHYNQDAGQDACKTQWLTALGY